MLKVVVFDSGYGGELFADYIEAELPVVEVIRVIDWRNADIILTQPKSARKVAESALRPYIGRVDLIVFANQLLSFTSLKYFRRKYKNQKFLGIGLEEPSTFIKRDTLILATKALTKTANYYNYLLRIKRKTKTLSLDDWIPKIDDGELEFDEIRETLLRFVLEKEIEPKEIILGCTCLKDIESDIRKVFGSGVKIYDDFLETIRKIYHILHIRGGNGKKRQ